MSDEKMAIELSPGLSASAQAGVPEIERLDDSTIVRMMQSHAIQEYVYSFKQGGRTIEGLTIAGINEAANRRGGIEVSDLQIVETEQAFRCTIKATDVKTLSSRYGAFEQMKSQGGKVDVYAFTKAVHKAQRNAVKQLLPVPVLREVMSYYLLKSSRAMVLRQVELLEGEFRKAGLTAADYWCYVKNKYGVESGQAVTDAQWQELRLELRDEGRVIGKVRDWKGGGMELVKIHYQIMGT